MRALVLVASGVFVFGFPSHSNAEDVGCRAVLSTQQPGQEHALMLTAAGSLYSEARAITDTVLGRDWHLIDPWNIANRIPADSLRVGSDHLCSWLQSLPREKRIQYSQEIAEWIKSYRTVEVLLWLSDVESLGSAVAHQSETQSLFPRNKQDIQDQGARVGESLASGENTGLWYDLASYLASRPGPERRRVVEELLELGRILEKMGR